MNTEKTNITDGESGREEQRSLFGLKEIRESKGISFQDIVAATKVSPLMINAIDGHDFEKLPEPVYTKAFLKSYARALNIDSAPVIQRYDDYCATLEAPNKQYDNLKKRRHKRSGLPRFILAVTLIGLVFLVLYYFWGFQPGWYPLKTSVDTENGDAAFPVGRDSSAVERIPEKEEAIPGFSVTPAQPPSAVPAAIGEQKSRAEKMPPVEEGVADAAAPVSTERAVNVPETSIEAGAIAEPAEAVDDLVLVIRATELTWLQIIRDKELPEQLYLKAGGTITRHAKNGFDIIVGNAGGTEVLFQGTSLGSIGNRGEVVFLTLPREGEAIKPD